MTRLVPASRARGPFARGASRLVVPMSSTTSARSIPTWGRRSVDRGDAVFVQEATEAWRSMR